MLLRNLQSMLQLVDLLAQFGLGIHLRRSVIAIAITRRQVGGRIVSNFFAARLPTHVKLLTLYSIQRYPTFANITINYNHQQLYFFILLGKI